MKLVRNAKVTKEPLWILMCVHVEYSDTRSVHVGLCVYVFMGDNAKCNSCFSLAENSAFVAAQASHYRAGVTPKNPR